MSSNFDAYDSEKMFVSGKVQLYTKVGAKKLVMNCLKNNKKKISNFLTRIIDTYDKKLTHLEINLKQIL